MTSKPISHSRSSWRMAWTPMLREWRPTVGGRCSKPRMARARVVTGLCRMAPIRSWTVLAERQSTTCCDQVEADGWEREPIDPRRGSSATDLLVDPLRPEAYSRLLARPEEPRQSEDKNMLILSRRVGETVINGDGVITLLGLKGDQVRVAIDAPKAVSVTREKVYERTKYQTRNEHRNASDSGHIAWVQSAKAASIARRDPYRSLRFDSGPHFETVSRVCVAPDGTAYDVPRIATEDLPSRAQRAQQ